MKVLFLDIDGVLNCDTTKERIKKKGYTGLCGIDEFLRDRFLEWWNSRTVHIVLSSMWRYHPDMMELLHENGIHFTDTTPTSSFMCWQVAQVVRGDEIQEWLNSHQHVTHYAILDDNDWFKDDQRAFFVQTDPRVGVTDADLKRVEEILEV